MMMTQTNDNGNGPRPKRDQIAENLKRVYDETLAEPLPEKLINLLESLKKTGRD